VTDTSSDFAPPRRSALSPLLSYVSAPFVCVAFTAIDVSPSTTATGASLTGFTVILTVASSETSPSESVIVYFMESLPL